MKSLLLKIITWKLAFIAKLTIAKFKPKVIGITGSVGKTSTKMAIQTVLKENGHNVRAAGGNLNNEIGLPLAILGDYQTSEGGFFFLSNALWRGFLQLLFTSSEKYPNTLILEYGADHPGDIDYLVKLAKPNIALITAIGKTPVHIEFYKDAKEVAAEKAKLIQAVPRDGVSVINGDDESIRSIAQKSGGKLKTYGFKKGNNILIESFKTSLVDGSPRGISFALKTVEDKGSVSLEGVLGRSYAYSCAGALAVALAMDTPFDKAVKALQKYKGVKGRARLIPGIKDTLIIDDSYNASPKSTANALEAIKNISGKKIAVIGDMLELGDKSNRAHQEIGKIAGDIINTLIAVGPQSKIVTEAASIGPIRKNNVYAFSTAQEAADKLKELIEGGETILIKGSQSIRTEKITKAIMKNPSQAGDLLVRQYGKWLKS